MCWQLHFPVDFSALNWRTSRFIYMYCTSWLNTYDCCACVLTLGCGWKCRAVNVCIVQCTFILCCHCLYSCRMGTLHSWGQPTLERKILWRSFSHQGLPLSALILWAHVLYRVHSCVVILNKQLYMYCTPIPLTVVNDWTELSFVPKQKYPTS